MRFEEVIGAGVDGLVVAALLQWVWVALNGHWCLYLAVSKGDDHFGWRDGLGDGDYGQND